MKHARFAVLGLTLTLTVLPALALAGAQQYLNPNFKTLSENQ